MLELLWLRSLQDHPGAEQHVELQNQTKNNGPAKTFPTKRCSDLTIKEKKPEELLHDGPNEAKMISMHSGAGDKD